jgi:hypothetical protein
MLSELHSLNFKLCSKQYNKKFVLHLIVAPQLGGSRQHNYSTKTRQAGCANEQSMYSLMSMGHTNRGAAYRERGHTNRENHGKTMFFTPPFLEEFLVGYELYLIIINIQIHNYLDYII